MPLADKKISPKINVEQDKPPFTCPWLKPDKNFWVDPWNSGPLLDYYRNLLRAYGYIRLLGLPQIKENPDIPVETLFVEPEFSKTLINPDTPVDKWPERMPVEEALIKSPRLVVLGNPGAGKTSLLQWIILQFCRSSASRLQTELGSLVPLPFTLRELRLSEFIDWPHLVNLFLEQEIATPLRDQQPLLRQLLDNGQAIILLDGLDEVSSEKSRLALRYAVMNGIWNACSCRWLMTSRVVGYDQVPFHRYISSQEFTDLYLRSNTSSPTFNLTLNPSDYVIDETQTTDIKNGVITTKLLYLAPFSDRQINSLISNWYTMRESDPTVRNESIKELLKAIWTHAGTARLARIPNLLTMIALIHRHRAKLPQGRVNLYNEIAEAYLHSIEDFRGLKENSYTLAQKKQWLAHIGFEMQRLRLNQTEHDAKSPDAESGVLVDRTFALKWLVEAMSNDEPNETTTAALNFLDYLQRRTGLFLERSPDKWGFLHLSFQEYFAACYLAEEVTGPDWLSPDYNRLGCRPVDLQAYSDNELWKEVFIFMFEMLGQERPRWVDVVARNVFKNTLLKPMAFLNHIGRRQNITPWYCNHPDVTLLAELSVDTYFGGSAKFREEAWSAIWRCAYQDAEGYPPNESAQAMLSGAQSYLPEIWKTLIPVASQNTARTLNLLKCESLEDISPLGKVSELERVVLFDCSIRAGLKQLETLPRLRELRMEWKGLLSDLISIRNLPALEQLTLALPEGVLDLRCLTPLPKLRQLCLRGPWSIKNPELLEQLKSLKEFFAILTDGEGIRHCLNHLPPLRRLEINAYGWREGIEGINFPTVEELILENFEELRDLRQLGIVNGLKSLSLLNCKNIDDLWPLVQLADLQKLNLSYCYALTSLAALVNCQNLKEIEAHNCGRLSDIPPALKAKVKVSVD